MKRLILALSATLALPLATANAESAGERSAPILFGDDGSVKVDGETYPSLTDFLTSPEFEASGKRCGAPQATLEDLGALDFAPSDCSETQTSIEGEYDPAAGEEYVIQVVFHVLSNGGGAADIDDSFLNSQVEILNEDFNALSGTPGAPGTNGKIRFVLASTDPDGNQTNGIVRITNFQGSFPDNDITRDTRGYAWPTGSYLNIFTANLPGGLLGFVADFPHRIAGQPSDGVYALFSSVGRNASGAPFNQGRTLTHEVGHYMGLYHTFQGGCGTGYTGGDKIADTVPTEQPNFGCSPGASSCQSANGANNPIDNYMDYSDDTCMDSFSPEQINRMRCVMVHYRSTLYNAIPKADFTTESDKLESRFVDLSSDSDGTVVAWEWDFGDSSTSTEQNPTHAYGAFGVYDVTLTVTDDRGVRGSVTKTAVANIAPVADFDHEDNGLAVIFEDKSSDENGSITNWEWDFGDGNTSNEQNPNHGYLAEGKYTVTLTVTDDLTTKTTTTKELDISEGGCGCSSSGSGGPWGTILVFGMAFLAIRRRHPRA